jgi:hypothetical protein
MAEKDLVVHSAYMRTIEGGFSVVRPTYHGITFAADYNGNIGMVHEVHIRNKSTFTNSDGFSIVSGKLKQLTS